MKAIPLQSILLFPSLSTALQLKPPTFDKNSYDQIVDIYKKCNIGQEPETELESDFETCCVCLQHPATVRLHSGDSNFNGNLIVEM